eukprot:533501-Rhodomonas_salina.1
MAQIHISEAVCEIIQCRRTSTLEVAIGRNKPSVVGSPLPADPSVFDQFFGAKVSVRSPNTETTSLDCSDAWDKGYAKAFSHISCHNKANGMLDKASISSCNLVEKVHCKTQLPSNSLLSEDVQDSAVNEHSLPNTPANFTFLEQWNMISLDTQSINSDLNIW